VALAAVESPFVVNLKYAFVSDTDVFLILDLMTGGDLSFHLAQKKRFSKPEAQYVGERASRSNTCRGKHSVYLNCTLAVNRKG